MLVRTFLTKFTEENDKHLEEIEPAAMEILMDYHWPGNVRELENVIERAVVLSSGRILTVDLLPPAVREPSGLPTPVSLLPTNGVSFKEAVAAYERQLIVRALQNADGVQKRAAQILKVKPTTLHEMMKRLEISVDRVPN